MKKAIVMAGVLFALTMTAGCGSQNQDHAATAESQTQDTASGSSTAAQSENTDQKQTDGDRTDTAEADVTEEALQDNENTEKSSKVLVAYYSATGNTKAAAETIADAAGGELFELQPAEAYTTEDLDYNDPESRVCKEHEDPDLQDVKTLLDFQNHTSCKAGIFCPAYSRNGDNGIDQIRSEHTGNGNGQNKAGE